MSKYSVILPTYNERYLRDGKIKVKQLNKQSNLDFEIVIIEDNSHDGTLQVGQELKKVYGDKFIIHFREKKLVLRSAYMDGIKLCLGNFIIIMDVDLSHHPKYLKDFIQKQKETNRDIVTGSKYINKGGVMNWGNLHHEVAISLPLLCQVLNVLIQLEVLDSTKEKSQKKQLRMLSLEDIHFKWKSLLEENMDLQQRKYLLYLQKESSENQD